MSDRDEQVQPARPPAAAPAWLRAARYFAPSASPEDARTIILIWLITTAVLWLIAYGASTTFAESELDVKTPPVTIRPLDVWIRWDAVHYLAITEKGYRGRPDLAAWFPLYPYLTRALMPVARHQHLVAQAISLGGFLLLLFVLFDVVQRSHGAQAARLTVLYLSIFPSTLFFRALYPESLFVLFVLLSYRSFLGERYLRCGIWGALAAATSLTGIMLLPAFGVAALWKVWRGRGEFRPAVLWILWIAAGLATVMWIQWAATGDPLRFWHNRPEPRLSWPGAAWVQDWAFMARAYDFRAGHIAFNLLISHAAVILAVPGVILIYRRYGFTAGTLSLCLLLPGLTSTLTYSMLRFMLPVFFFPLLLAEAGARRPWFHTAWIYVSGLLASYYTICFACWYLVG